MATSAELFNKLLKESMENQTNVVIDKHGENTDTTTTQNRSGMLFNYWRTLREITYYT